MNEDIEDIFSDKVEEKIMTEVKRKRNILNLRLVIIAIVSTLIIIIGGVFVLNFASFKYINNSYTKDKEVQELEYDIMHPNEYIGKESCRETGYFKFESTYEYGKRLDSKVIYAGSDSYLGGMAKNKISTKSWILSSTPLNDDINKRYSNVYGLRKLIFLYPYIHYGKNIYEFSYEENTASENNSYSDEDHKINDFHFLNEINDNKIVEMTLSFDKEYIYEDINKMIASNLITFYWIDNNSEEEKKSLAEHTSIAFSAVGIKSTKSNGEFQEDVNGRMENFKATVRRLKELGHTQYVGNIDENNFRISGVVVVGSPKELMSIQNNPIIKHAVIGTVVDKY